MATGESFHSLAFAFRTHYTWVSRIIHATLAAIVKNLMHIAMPTPTEETWKKNASDFEIKWSYPNCIAAIDGMHVRLRCPNKTGSLCYNYKDFFSVVLLGLVDANYKFVAVDIGAYGRENDAGVFAKSSFGRRIRDGTFSIPPPKKLPGTDIEVPHVIVGDEAFGLHQNLMKSYARRTALDDRSKLTYNYRHSHARRVSENAFGIMGSIFRIFSTPIHSSMHHINNIIMDSCILYNLMRNESIDTQQMHQMQPNGMETKTTENFLPLAVHNTRSFNDAYQVRDEFKEYFNGVGRTTWQDQHIDANF